MEITVNHKTTYTYKDPVKLDTHYLHFYPLSRPHIDLLNFDLSVSPEPEALSPRVDTENNRCHQLWFKQGSEVTEFTIKSKIVLSVEPYNPFRFLLTPGFSLDKSPIIYPDELLPFLNPYLSHTVYPELQGFVDEIQEESKNDVIKFLTKLIVYICQFWDHQRVDEPMTLNALDCYKSKKGSCKELSWMLIIMLRAKGFASRFVSGYAFNPTLGEGHELHAWVEVLLPGAGWVGIDPSAGLFTNQYYIPIAVSYAPKNTMPVTGFYLGNTTSSLETSVELSVSE